MKYVLKGPRITLMHLEPCMHNAKLLYDVESKNKEFLLPWLSWARDIKSANDTYVFLKQSDKSWENNSAYEYFIVSTEFAAQLPIISSFNTIKYS